ECHPKLTFSTHGFKFVGVGVKSAIGCRERYRIPVRIKGRIDLSPVEPAGYIDPSIEAQGRVTRSNLRSPGVKKSGQNDFPHIGLAITVGVLQVPDIGGTSYEYTAFPGKDSIGIGKIIGKFM